MFPVLRHVWAQVAPEALLRASAPAVGPIVRVTLRLLRTTASGPGTLLSCTAPQLEVFCGAVGEVPRLLKHLPPAPTAVQANLV